MTDDGWKNLRVREELHARLEELKQGDESFGDVIERLLDESEASDERDVPLLTEAHIDDIVTQTANRTADEVENRMQGR